VLLAKTAVTNEFLGADDGIAETTAWRMQQRGREGDYGGVLLFRAAVPSDTLVVANTVATRAAAAVADA
jgi:hypothetical protein